MICLTVHVNSIVLHNEELHNFGTSQRIIRVIKSRRMRWVGHVTGMGDERFIQDFGQKT